MVKSGATTVDDHLHRLHEKQRAAANPER